MTERSAEHATFQIEHVYAAAPEHVYLAWSDPKTKAQWFGPTNSSKDLQIDFQVDGREQFSMKLPDGRMFGYEGRFQEIVPQHRIVYSYTVDIDRTRISASLVTVEIKPHGAGAHLRYTEQAVYLDDGDRPADRKQGADALLENLANAL